MFTSKLPAIVSVCLALAITSCKNEPVNEAVAIVELDLLKGVDSELLGEKAYDYTAKILDFGPRSPQSIGLAKTKQFLIEELKKVGWVAIEQPLVAQTQRGKLNYSNIVARYSPSQSSNPWARSVEGVLAAHVDSKLMDNFIGADDAASSVASILVVAQLLHHDFPDQARKLELVFFDGEEAVGEGIEYMQDGLFGSIHYSKYVQRAVASAVAPYSKPPKFGLVLDMIGHRELSVKIPSDTPAFLKESYDDARKKLGLEAHFDHALIPILDDHYPMNVIARIPTMDLIGDFNSKDWWHKSTDDLSVISKESLSMSLQMTLEILSNQL